MLGLQAWATGGLSMTLKFTEPKKPIKKVNIKIKKLFRQVCHLEKKIKSTFLPSGYLCTGQIKQD
jgi:hypothetical protein